MDVAPCRTLPPVLPLSLESDKHANGPSGPDTKPLHGRHGMTIFQCPTKVIETVTLETGLEGVLRGRRWALLTSPGWLGERDLLGRLRACGLVPDGVYSPAPVNPQVGQVEELFQVRPEAEVIVSVGGGSVLDAAKGISALAALGGDRAAFERHLEAGEPLASENDGFLEQIAVPTTSGTGSEITRWGTIWGEDGRKFSVQHPALYPSVAILDPGLCLSMPANVTLATGLDALSHALEAIWNQNSCAVSDQLALAAVRRVLRTLPAVLETPEDLDLRQDMQTAALLSGLAMSTTKTALAHSISYPFTAQYGLPHGLACSFTLAEVARFNAEDGSGRMARLAEAFDCPKEDVPDRLESFLVAVGLPDQLAHYLGPDAADAFGDNLITPARAANNLRAVDGAGAKSLAQAALRRLLAE